MANTEQSTQILQSMINFIKAHGEDRVKEIHEQAHHDFSIGREKMVEREKVRMEEQMRKDLANTEVKMKIERSAIQNKARVDRMRKTAQLVDGLLLDAKQQMHETLQRDQSQYKRLLEDLLVQGLIKMLEPKVILKVRKSDLAIVKSVIEPAKKAYKAQMLQHVKSLEDRDDIPCRIDIDEKNFLPEWDPGNDKNSCLGGFQIFAYKNRITCMQTLDDRMELVFAQATPQIRHMLFPSLRKHVR